MDLTGIISISGKPGLFKVIAQGKNSIIVESLIDKKRVPAYASDRISALEDISIYTHDSDKPLKEVLADIYKKQEGKEAPSHKEDISVLQNYLLEILPDYDDERVYASDIKKLFQWYNMLLKADMLKPEKKETEKKEKTAKKEKTESKPAKTAVDKKPTAKKTAAKTIPGKTANVKAKPAAAKKTTVQKSSKGK